jgi:exosortase
VTSLFTNALSEDRIRVRLFWLFFLVAVSIAVWWLSLVETFELALHNEAYTHILVIVPMSLVFILLEDRKSLVASEGRKKLGAILLSISLVLRIVIAGNIWRLESSDVLSLNMFTLVVWWIGSVIVCFGTQGYKRLVFPVTFLFLVVPLPERAVAWLTVFLQHQSAVAASAIFRVARVPVMRDGVMLSIPGLDIEVSRECSSIRSSTMLLVLTLALVHLFLRSWWRQILLVVAALLLAVVKNAIRIFTIAELGTRVDPSYLHGRLHRQGGVLFLALALSIESLLLWWLRRNEASVSQRSSMARPASRTYVP